MIAQLDLQRARSGVFDGGPATLGEICTDVGPRLVEVVLAPLGLSPAVERLTLLDPQESPAESVSARDLVLAVGMSGADSPSLQLLAASGALGATAVVFRTRAKLLDAAAAAADEAGVAILQADPDVPWSALYALLRASMASQGCSPARLAASAIGDLVGLADSTAAAAGGPVTIEDLHGRVLAFSAEGQDVDEGRAATVLGRRVPEPYMRRLRAAGVIDRLIVSEDIVSVALPGVAPRRAIAIRLESAAVGAIWVAGDEQSLARGADNALRQAARVAAVHLSRHSVLDDLDRRVQDGLVHAVLAGEGPADLLIERLGLPAGGGFAVIALGAGERPSSERSRLAALLLAHLTAYRWAAAATTRDGGVHAIVGAKGAPDARALAKTVEDCLTRIRRQLDIDLSAGIGDVVEAAHDLPSARVTADRSLELKSSANRVVVFDDVRSQALLADVGGFVDERDVGLCAELRALVDHDRRHDTAYVPTLRAYLDALGDMALAADRIQVHVNTVRYRMRRIHEISKVDLSDGDTRLMLELQMRSLPARNGRQPRGRVARRPSADPQ